MRNEHKPPQPSYDPAKSSRWECCALKGVSNRVFYRWFTRDYGNLFPHLPERTRLFRLFW